MTLTAAKEAYRRAETRLRELLFGDSVYSGGQLRGEEHRQEASRQIRRMRTAFEEAVEAGEDTTKPDLARELLDQTRRQRSREK
jgi:hypothetical protein